MPIEYSVSIVNNENNSGMILEDIFNCQPEIIRKYFGMQIDMEIVLKCKFHSDNFIFIVILYNIINLYNLYILDVIFSDRFNRKLHQQKVSLNRKQ